MVELRLRQDASVAREVTRDEGHALGKALYARRQLRSRVSELTLQLDSNHLAPGVRRQVAGGPTDSGADVQDGCIRLDAQQLDDVVASLRTEVVVLVQVAERRKVSELQRTTTNLAFVVQN